MNKLFVFLMGLVVSTSLYLQAEFTPEQVTAHFTSGDFEREWNAHGYSYTPQQVEACVDRLVAAVNKPEYIEQVMPLITAFNDFEAGGGMGDIDVSNKLTLWNMLLPLKYLSSEDKTMIFHFFYSLKQMIPLKYQECLLTEQLQACHDNNIQPDTTIMDSLTQVRKDIETLSQGTTMGALAVVAGYHAIGMLTPEALEYLNTNPAQLNLK